MLQIHIYSTCNKKQEDFSIIRVLPKPETVYYFYEAQISSKPQYSELSSSHNQVTLMCHAYLLIATKEGSLHDSFMPDKYFSRLSSQSIHGNQNSRDESPLSLVPTICEWKEVLERTVDTVSI